MPDGRLVQFVIGAAFIDQEPAVASGICTGMCILKAGPTLAKDENGKSVESVHYIAWHAKAPPIAVSVGGHPTWIEVDVDPPDEQGLIIYRWKTVPNKRKAVSQMLWGGAIRENKPDLKMVGETSPLNLGGQNG